MRIAIVQFPGSNCERETILAVIRAGMTPVEFLWNEPNEKLIACDGYVIVGGFSYEDRSRAGAIAACDPIMQVIKAQSELGKPVLGICNGAQILVESGLVPGLENYTVDMALTENKRMKLGKVLGAGYYNAWANIKLSDNHRPNAFTRHMTQDTCLNIPVAHAEGRFVIPNALLTEIQAQGLAVFQYCDAQGNVVDEFPINPNGSVSNIAGISNQAGNVLALMPHPERTPVGDCLFHSMRDYIASGDKSPFSPLAYRPSRRELKPFAKSETAKELVIELIITDNHALSVENMLRQQGIPATIKRQIHWEIVCDTEATFEQIKASGILFNDRKEFVVPCLANHVIPAQAGIHPQNNMDVGTKIDSRLCGNDRPHYKTFLVRAKDDLLGLQKMQQLERHFSVDGVHAIRHSVLWHIGTETAALDTVTQHVLNTNILFNASSHECYDYV